MLRIKLTNQGNTALKLLQKSLNIPYLALNKSFDLSESKFLLKNLVIVSRLIGMGWSSLCLDLGVVIVKRNKLFT
jgi:hypothetical protein